MGPKDLVWRPLAHTTVWWSGTAVLIVPDGFTNFDASDCSDFRLPPFYPGVFTVCKTLVQERKEQCDSFYRFVEEADGAWSTSPNPPGQGQQ